MRPLNQGYALRAWLPIAQQVLSFTLQNYKALAKELEKMRLIVRGAPHCNPCARYMRCSLCLGRIYCPHHSQDIRTTKTLGRPARGSLAHHLCDVSLWACSGQPSKLCRRLRFHCAGEPLKTVVVNLCELNDGRRKSSWVPVSFTSICRPCSPQCLQHRLHSRQVQPIHCSSVLLKESRTHKTNSPLLRGDQQTSD